MAYVVTTLGVLVFTLTLYCYVRLFSHPRPPNLPPGPPTLPILGNLHQLSVDKGFLKIEELSRKYSSHGIMALQLGPGVHAVVINSWRVARDLLDKRGGIYSSRPPFPATHFMSPSPSDYHLALLRYGPEWRKKRKTFIEFFKDKEMKRRVPIDEAESSQLMYELLVEPGRFQEHVLRYHGAIIMASVFGMRAKVFADGSLIRRFFRVQKEWEKVTVSGFVPPYDVFPFLKIVPEFLTPWRGWKQRVESVGRNQYAFYRDIVAGVREGMAQDRAKECFMMDLLRRQEKDEYADVDLEYIGGVLMDGGIDTTASTFKSFLLAMAAYPSVLRAAQEEVDSVFGGNRIPTMTNNPELPYLTACLLEVLRWRPTIASGVPHATTHDDNYEGFFIPANTMVIMNIWGINHDPEEFDNPEAFDPTRFLRHPSGSKVTMNKGEDHSGRRPDWAFGAGRRVCVGQDMARRSLLLTMAKVVWCFDIEAISPEGIDTSADGIHGGMTLGPKPFEARFRVRGDDRKRIIEWEWEKADAYLKRFE